MSTTTYKYKANNEESYQSLAMYVITLPVTVSLFPKYQTIAVPECASKKVGEFIDDEALDFTIAVAQIEVDDLNELLADPTVDTSILRDIAESFQEEKEASAELYKRNIDEVTKERGDVILALENAKKDVEQYSRWWKDELNKHDRIHKQVDAIAALLGSIYPKQ